MSVPPGDLPRSSSGRGPRWVVDEATRPGDDPTDPRPTSSTPPTTPPTTLPTTPATDRRPRARAGASAVVVVVAAVAGAWWWAGAPGLPAEVAPAQPASVTSPGGGEGGGEGGGADVAPTPEVEALADAARLSEEGRALFYRARPEVLDEQEFAGRCGDPAAGTGDAGGGVVGCYQPGTESIVLYRPADPRLGGALVESAAHETLHVAWMQLGSGERAELAEALEDEVGAVPADDEIHAQIDGSVGEHRESRHTELFAYVGTQVWRPGGLDPALEAVYARFIADRPGLVAVHSDLEAMFDGLEADVRSASSALVEQERAAARGRAEHDALAASVAAYRQEYEANVAQVAALPPEERERTLLEWIWRDGTPLPSAPADEFLADAAALLARDEADLAARAATVAAAEEAAAAERARVEALTADLRALQEQVVPGDAG